MCFLKFLSIPSIERSISKIPTETESENDSFDDSQKEIKQKLLKKSCLPNANSFLLINLLSQINLNSKLLNQLDNKITESNQMLNLSLNEAIKEENSSEPAAIIYGSPEESCEKEKKQQEFGCSDTLLQKVFGMKNYQYKLVLDEEFNKNLLKDINFNLGVKLVDRITAMPVKNSNLINVCFGVCESNGEWISIGNDHQHFLKGRTSSEIYNGEGKFVKMSSKGISRPYQGRVVNFVVYPRPSLLKYHCGSDENLINIDLIEPLLIENICVKAKKSQ